MQTTVSPNTAVRTNLHIAETWNRKFSVPCSKKLNGNASLGEHQPVETIIRHMQTRNDLLVLFASRAFQETAALLPGMPEDASAVYERLKKDTQAGNIRTDYYKLYAFWALTYIFELDL